MQKRDTEHRSYIVVINNYTEEDVKKFKTTKSRYKVFGYEIGKKSKIPHMQGYIYFSSAKLFSSMKRRFPTAHIEPAEGDAQSNRVYSTKDGHFWEKGNIPKQGRRTDLDSIVELVQNNATNYEIAKKRPKTYMMYSKHINVLRDVLNNNPRTPDFYKVIDGGVVWTYEYVQTALGEDDVVYIDSLNDLSEYNRTSFKTILYSGEVTSKFLMYERGYIPITYKYGYETRRVNCISFVCMASAHLYQKLSFIDIEEKHEERSAQTGTSEEDQT